MPLRVIVWGTGNVGEPALRAVISHQGLDLVGVITSSEAKDGQDAGALAGLGITTGIAATRDWQAAIAKGCDAVVYAATADSRFEGALNDIMTCLRAGINVVAAGMYPLQSSATAPAPLLDLVNQACAASGASILVTGIDPGWAMDALALNIAGMSSDITEIRCQEIMNYRHYDQPDVVRNVIGFGGPMDQTPMMLFDPSLRFVWEPTVRALGDALGRPVDQVTTHVERQALARDIDVPGMGRFEAGTQGAFRFELIGHSAGKPFFVIEHVTRIDNECAPDWPYPPTGEGSHGVVVTGNPVVHVSVHAEDPHKPGPGGGGNATAACRLVNAIPFVCSAPPGIVPGIAVPMHHDGMQLRG